MKIAIHDRPDSFSSRWIEYCTQENISYKLVNCYGSDIISQLADCSALLWHHHHADYRDILFAKQLLFALQQADKKVFPNFNTCWHFDDKVGQKYLLESIGAPMVPSYVFYDENEALMWAKSTTFPKVFKLRRGAGSANVKLVNSEREAIKIIKKSFSKGFSQFDRRGYLNEQVRRITERNQSLITGILKGFGRLFIQPEYVKKIEREKGYIYFQEFVPDNKFDLRIIVIGDKAFAIKRLIRNADFRASGSGHIVYKKEEIDIRCIDIAFRINENIASQSIAYDFLFDKDQNPLIIEISYCWTARPYDECPGYWDKNLNWHNGKFNPYGWMIENLISSLGCRE